MTIQPLGRGNLALSLSSADLIGIPSTSLTDLSPCQLVEFIRRNGVTLPPRTRMEVYLRGDTLLVFIQPPRRPRHYGYIF